MAGPTEHRLIAIHLDDEDDTDSGRPDLQAPEAGRDAEPGPDANTDASPDDAGGNADASDEAGPAPDGPAPDASVEPPPVDAAAREASAGDANDAEATEAAAPSAWVEVGIPDGVTGIEYVDIQDGDTIPIQEGGQGGTHARIALQVKGLGNRVFYQVFIRDLDGGGEVQTLPLVRERPIACDANGLCRIGPLFVLLGGLAPKEEWDGLNVRVRATVRNAAGVEVEGSVTGVLHWFEE